MSDIFFRFVSIPPSLIFASLFSMLSFLAILCFCRESCDVHPVSFNCKISTREYPSCLSFWKQDSFLFLFSFPLATSFCSSCCFKLLKIWEGILYSFCSSEESKKIRGSHRTPSKEWTRKEMKVRKRDKNRVCGRNKKKKRAWINPN